MGYSQENVFILTRVDPSNYLAFVPVPGDLIAYMLGDDGLWWRVYKGDPDVNNGKDRLAGRGGATFSGNVTINVAGSTNMGESEMSRVARTALVDALEEVTG